MKRFFFGLDRTCVLLDFEICSSAEFKVFVVNDSFITVNFFQVDQ